MGRLKDMRNGFKMWLIVSVMVGTLTIWLAGCRSTAATTAPMSEPGAYVTSGPLSVIDIIDIQTQSLLRGTGGLTLQECSGGLADSLTINVPIATSHPGSVSSSLPVDLPALPAPLIATRTPSPLAQCPLPSASFVVDPSTWDVLNYLNEGRPVGDLEKLLSWQRADVCRSPPGRLIWSSARVFHTDITGDSVPDVLVVRRGGWQGIQDKGRSVYGATLSLFYCCNGQYEGDDIVSTSAGSWLFNYPADALNPVDYGVWNIQDMNGNGVPEVIFSYVDGSQEGKVIYPWFRMRWIHIMEWDGNQMVHLINPNDGTSGALNVVSMVPGNDSRVTDIDGNGTLELVVVNYAPCFEGENRQVRLEVYGWDGNYFSLVHSEESAQSVCPTE